MATLYQNTGRLHPSRSVFNLSHTFTGSCDIGYLFPVMLKSMAPGDIFEIGQNVLLKFEPIIKPLMQEINAYTWTFFVPYRLLDENFEDFVTGGWDGRHLPDGDDPISLPLWSGNFRTMQQPDPNYTLYMQYPTLYDYFGFSGNTSNNVNSYPTNERPKSGLIDYPLRAYNFIYNEYFRDQNLEPEIEYPYNRQAVVDADKDPAKPGNRSYYAMSYYTSYNGQENLQDTNLFWGNWAKDYFTISLPFQQRGPSPALPLYGQGDIVNSKTFFQDPTQLNPGPGQRGFDIEGGDPNIYMADGPGTRALYNYLNQNYLSGHVKLTEVNAGDVNDLRWAFQIQKFMERNARIGARYTEILYGRYGQPMQDVRLSRPEYIGGSKNPVIISEVLNMTEGSDHYPTGYRRGHGVSSRHTFIGKYRAKEFGLVMTLMCIKPIANYASQGYDREWTIKTPFDLITPEFVNLSEQAILNKELFFIPTAPTWNDEIFGFQGRYDEYRSANNKVTTKERYGDFNDFNWTLRRKWDPNNQTNWPRLNMNFIKINPHIHRRIYLKGTNDMGINYQIGNIIKAIRPLPIIAEPGLIDHH